MFTMSVSNRHDRQKERLTACRMALKEKGLKKAFFVGGNSSCRVHIRQHYSLYKERCKEAGIPENHHAIPRPIWKKMQEQKNLKDKGTTQMKLDGIFEKQDTRREFTREGVLHAIAQFIACGDQALAVADNVLFRNCLVAMRPKTVRHDLASTHEVGMYIHNEFAKWLRTLKSEILVS